MIIEIEHRKLLIQVTVDLEVDALDVLNKLPSSKKIEASVAEAINNALRYGYENGFNHKMENELSIFPGQAQTKIKFDGTV